MVQQRQPFSSTTTESELLAKSWWSRPTSPNSFTTTTVFASSLERSAVLMRVVFPLPRNPVTRVTGIRLLMTAGEASIGIRVLGQTAVHSCRPGLGFLGLGPF